MQHTSTHTSSQPSTGRCTQSVLIVWASSRGVGRYRALSGASCKRPDTDMAVAATRSAKPFLHRDPRDGDEGEGATSHQPPGLKPGCRFASRAGLASLRPCQTRTGAVGGVGAGITGRAGNSWRVDPEPWLLYLSGNAVFAASTSTKQETKQEALSKEVCRSTPQTNVGGNDRHHPPSGSPSWSDRTAAVAACRRCWPCRGSIKRRLITRRRMDGGLSRGGSVAVSAGAVISDPGDGGD